ncbi:MAG TPA: hypothetical protein VHR66_19605 [Gemmataceae bacterium]|nr:hypothetical protein [Gemmataceae bacterium]
MSYLHAPRLSFAGKFFADPSTVDNNRNNFNLGVPLNQDPIGPNNNYGIGWNFQGTHVFRIEGGKVGSVDSGNGPVLSGDPLVGATVESVLDYYKYPAKLVDLDPDQQSVSAVWGLQLRVSIADPTNPATILAGVSGLMPPTAFADMWTRVLGTLGGMSFFSAVFTSVLTNLKWIAPEKSPVLSELFKLSPDRLSLRLIVDSYQPRATSATFRFGRVVGTIGPALAKEPVRYVGGRRLSAAANPNTGSPAYGPVPAVVDGANSRLLLDLGNFVPTKGPPGIAAVPPEGWPVRASDFELYVTTGPPAVPPSPHTTKSADIFVAAPPSTKLGSIHFDPADYTTAGGIKAVPLTKDQLALIADAPLSLIDVTAGGSTPAVAEDPSGLYVDVSEVVYRLEPGAAATVALGAWKFGQRAAGVNLDLVIQPQGQPDPNNTPAAGLAFPASVTTEADGTAAVALKAGDPAGVRKDMNIDGQVYFLGGPWTNLGHIFPLQSAPINVLVFDNYPVPVNPTWAEHVGPILAYYAQVYPYMKTIIDLADRDTVIQNADAILYVLNLEVEHPHYMPVLRDLSAGKRQMLVNWLGSSDHI